MNDAYDFDDMSWGREEEISTIAIGLSKEENGMPYRWKKNIDVDEMVFHWAERSTQNFITNLPP